MKITPQQQTDDLVEIDFVAVLRAAADEWDDLPAWRRWLAARLSNRDWGYALRKWAELELLQRKRRADK